MKSGRKRGLKSKITFSITMGIAEFCSSPSISFPSSMKVGMLHYKISFPCFRYSPREGFVYRALSYVSYARLWNVPCTEVCPTQSQRTPKGVSKCINGWVKLISPDPGPSQGVANPCWVVKALFSKQETQFPLLPCSRLFQDACCPSLHGEGNQEWMWTHESHWYSSHLQLCISHSWCPLKMLRQQEHWTLRTDTPIPLNILNAWF